jgi:hypothetical protein
MERDRLAQRELEPLHGEPRRVIALVLLELVVGPRGRLGDLGAVTDFVDLMRVV